MSVLQSKLAQYGGLGGAAKMGAGNNMSIWQMLGLGDQGAGYTAPIGPTQPGQAPMTGEAIDPQQYAQQQSEGLAALGRRLGTWGAGVSQASGATYGPPKSFGEVLAGGNQALAAQDQQNLANRKTEAEIGALGAKEKPDFEALAQAAMLRRQLGAPQPGDEAILKTFDAFNMTKQSGSVDPITGNVRMLPRASVFGPSGGNAQLIRQPNAQRPPLSSFMR